MGAQVSAFFCYFFCYFGISFYFFYFILAKMSLSTSQKLRFSQKQAGSQVQELRQRSVNRGKNAAPKLAERVRTLKNNIKVLQERNSAFSSEMTDQRHSITKDLIAAEDQHAHDYTELRKQFKEAKQSLENRRDSLLEELKPFRVHQVAGLEVVGELLQRYFELRESADVVHRNVTGTYVLVS